MTETTKTAETTEMDQTAHISYRFILHSCVDLDPMHILFAKMHLHEKYKCYFRKDFIPLHM